MALHDPPGSGNVAGPAGWQLTPADRARWELLAGRPGRSDAWIARAASVSVATVKRVRAGLELAGEIEPRHWTQRETRERPVAMDLERMANWSSAPVPDLSAGLCVGHPDADWWTSNVRAERRQAAQICRRCPVLNACALWSLSLPDSDRQAVLGGMSPNARRQQRGQRQQRGSEHCGTCGAEMTPENTYVSARQRQCRECRRRRDRGRRRRAARRAAAA